MNEEKLIQQGILYELRQKKLTLSMQIEGDLRAARNLTSGLGMRKLEELDLDRVLHHVTHAQKNWQEYLEICQKIQAGE